MSDEAYEERRRRVGVLVDAELLAVYLVGIDDEQNVPKNRRTNKYTVVDFRMLKNIIESSKAILTTPSILSEVSNHILDYKEPNSLQIRLFKSSMKIIEICCEEYVPKESILANPGSLIKLGFTDQSIIEAALKTSCAVVTADFKLTNYLTNAGCSVLNYNIIRGRMWGI